MKHYFVIASVALLTTACATSTGPGRQALYVPPPQITEVTAAAILPSNGPVSVRVTTLYFHNGEQQRDPLVPFSTHAKATVDKLPAFRVVEDPLAPELTLALFSTVDSKEANAAILKAGFTVGMGEVYLKRDFRLEAELQGAGMQRNVRASADDYFVATTRQHLAPEGSTPLSMHDGHVALYDALLYPVLTEIASQLP